MKINKKFKFQIRTSHNYCIPEGLFYFLDVKQTPIYKRIIKIIEATWAKVSYMTHNVSIFHKYKELCLVIKFSGFGAQEMVQKLK